MYKKIVVRMRQRVESGIQPIDAFSRGLLRAARRFGRKLDSDESGTLLIRANRGHS